MEDLGDYLSPEVIVLGIVPEDVILQVSGGSIENPSDGGEWNWED